MEEELLPHDEPPRKKESYIHIPAAAPNMPPSSDEKKPPPPPPPPIPPPMPPLRPRNRPVISQIPRMIAPPIKIHWNQLLPPPAAPTERPCGTVCCAPSWWCFIVVRTKSTASSRPWSYFFSLNFSTNIFSSLFRSASVNSFVCVFLPTSISRCPGLRQ